MESTIIYEVTNYDYDGCGYSWEGSCSFHKSYDKAAERVRSFVTKDSGFVLTRDEYTNWPVAFCKSGQYAYEKYYIQAHELED
jgi:hypothetical protein